MKTLVLFLSTLFYGLGCCNAQQDSVNITVTIDNVMNDNGMILTGLHSAETFMKGPGLENAQTDARKGSMTVTFKAATPGTYAISTLHDENANYRMDFTPEGLPAEPYAMSGNDNKMGPPSFDNCKFEVAGEDLQIKLRF